MERALVRVLAVVARQLPRGPWLALPSHTSKLERALVRVRVLARASARSTCGHWPALERALVRVLAMERALVRVLALVVRQLPSGQWLVLPSHTSKLERTLIRVLAMERASGQTPWLRRTLRCEL